MTSQPQFQSRPLLGQLFAQSQALARDERVLRTADRVLETDYSARTQQQRWEFEQQHPGVQYAPRSDQHPGVSQYVPGVKAMMVAGAVLPARAAEGAAIASLGSAPFMPGKAFGGSYNGQPVTQANRYFEKAGPVVLSIAWTLVAFGAFLGTGIVSAFTHDPGNTHVTMGVWAGVLVFAFFSLCGFMVWYLSCRTNRKEAQIVGGLFMILLALIGWKVSKMAHTPVPQQPQVPQQPHGYWNPLDGNH